MNDMTSMHAQHTATGPAAEAGGLAVAASGVLLSPNWTTLHQDTDRLHLGHPRPHWAARDSLSSSMSASCT
jgi:hypothetical protein